MSEQVPIPVAVKMDPPTPPLHPPASPTRTALTSWWRQFKQRNESDTSTGSASSSGGHSHYHHDSLSSHNQSNQSLQSKDTLQRPIMRHMSRSSGAVQGAKDRNTANGRSPSDGDVSAVFGEEIMAKIPPDLRQSPIFGVELKRSIKYANVAISLSDPSGEQFIYGYIPIVVAKCGVYLKKNATNVEGIFRLSGSARRIKELQIIFNTPPLFGHNLVWTGFNVHDAANVLRRYLNNLPEPIIPLKYYEQFRDPLREFPSIVTSITKNAVTHSLSNSLGGSSNASANTNPILVLNAKSDSTLNQSNESIPISGSESSRSTAGSSTAATNGTSKVLEAAPEEDEESEAQIGLAVKRYQQLILSLPSLNRQLLMYILDLLSIFAARSEETRMPASNLAAIFQPSLLSHPQHDMSPAEYRLSKIAIEFLILHSNSFLSYVESIAIRKHEESKAKRAGGLDDADSSDTTKNNSNSFSNPRTEKETGKGIDKGTDKALPNVPIHRRRHSRSLSSVQDKSHIASAVANASTGTHTKFPGKLHLPHVAIFSSSSADDNVTKDAVATDSSQPAGVTDDINSRAMETSSGGGMLSSVKRTVSFTRHNSKGRTASESSSSSTQDPLRRGSISSRNARTNGSVASHLTEDDSSATFLSPTAALPRNRTASDAEPPFLIDEVISQKVDTPRLSAVSLDSNTASSSHKFKSLDSVVNAGHNNDSSTSLTKTLSGSSIDDDSRPGRPTNAHGDGASPQRISKWRRSIMAHALNFDDGNGHSDLLAPPVLSGSEQLSPSSSVGSNGSKRSSWFRLRSRDRSSHDATD